MVPDSTCHGKGTGLTSTCPRCSGKRIHDANVVATMQTHGITRLLTQNPDDFTDLPQVMTVGNLPHPRHGLLTQALRSFTPPNQ